MGKAWPPGAAEHVTTARGDRTDGHFGFDTFRRHGSSVVHTPCWRNVSKPLLACSLALERVAPGGMGRAWPPGAAEHVLLLLPTLFVSDLGCSHTPDDDSLLSRDFHAWNRGERCCECLTLFLRLSVLTSFN